ncbi:hypothetical protein LguiB_009305 [Lonicera macranthoides]
MGERFLHASFCGLKSTHTMTPLISQERCNHFVSKQPCSSNKHPNALGTIANKIVIAVGEDSATVTVHRRRVPMSAANLFLCDESSD